MKAKAKVTKNGQWEFPGEDTIIPNANGKITMKGVNYPVWGIDDTGHSQMMYPGAEYQFPGNSVYEVPLNKFPDGGTKKRARTPIIVHDRNDPDLLNYRDSLSHYNAGEENLKRLLAAGFKRDGKPIDQAGWENYLKTNNAYRDDLTYSKGQYYDTKPVQYTIQDPSNPTSYTLKNDLMLKAAPEEVNMNGDNFYLNIPSSRIPLRTNANFSYTTGEYNRSRNTRTVNGRVVSDSGWRVDRDTRERHNEDRSTEVYLPMYTKPVQPYEYQPKPKPTGEYLKPLNISVSSPSDLPNIKGSIGSSPILMPEATPYYNAQQNPLYPPDWMVHEGNKWNRYNDSQFNTLKESKELTPYENKYEHGGTFNSKSDEFIGFVDDLPKAQTGGTAGNYVNKKGIIDGPIETNKGTQLPVNSQGTPVVNLPEFEVASTPTGTYGKPNPYSPVTGEEFLNSGWNPVNWFLPGVENVASVKDPKTGMNLPATGIINPVYPEQEFIGVGSVDKLSKADKVIDATKILTKRIPKTLQEDVVDLYRIQEKGAKTFSQLAAEGKIPKVFNNEKIIAKKAEEEKYFGQWFTKDKTDLDWYMKDREFTDPEIIQLRVPKSKLQNYTNYDKSLSRAPDREFVVPLEEQSQYRFSQDPKHTSISSFIDDIGRGFKSEIDWGKWNPETPNYPELINEYNTIEESTKKAGTWMKNSDGSTFQGTPEQFIQQNSSNFKKAYPNGFENVYRGVNFHNNEFPEKAIFTGNKNLAKKYTNAIGKENFLTSESHNLDAGVYNLAHKKSTNSIELNFNKDKWTDLPLKDKKTIINTKKKEFENYIKEVEENIKETPSLNDVLTTNKLKNIKKYKEELKTLKALKENDPKVIKILQDRLGSKTSTDDLAKYAEQYNVDNIKLNNINDGGLGDVSIINNKKGNYLKSLIGNNGMFDMTNPNIYKSILPALGTGVGGYNLFNKDQSNKYENGGTYRSDTDEFLGFID